MMLCCLCATFTTIFKIMVLCHGVAYMTLDLTKCCFSNKASWQAAKRKACIVVPATVEKER